MKKLLFFAVAVFAIGSIGGHINSAHAQTAGTQTLTPSQVAALQQELDVAKATLVNIEMQAGMIPGGDGGTAAATPTQTGPLLTTAGLTVSQTDGFEATLSTLAATLGQLNTSIAAHPTLTAEQTAAAQATLSDMSGILSTMSANITSDIAANEQAATPASPVAMNTPPSTAGTQTTPSQSAAPAPTVAANTAPSTPAATTPTTPTPVAVAQTTNAPQTAQASSLWSFTKSHWPTIVIVLLVIAILAILFWPEKEEVRTVNTSSATNKPKASGQPTVTVTKTTITSSSPSNAPSITANSTVTPATPVANAVAAPSQK